VGWGPEVLIHNRGRWLVHTALVATLPGQVPEIHRVTIGLSLFLRTPEQGGKVSTYLNIRHPEDGGGQGDAREEEWPYRRPAGSQLDITLAASLLSMNAGW
jgi:hypothetical protein